MNIGSVTITDVLLGCAVVKVTEGASTHYEVVVVSSNTLTPDGSSGNNAAVSLRESRANYGNGAGTITGNSADFGGCLLENQYSRKYA